MRKLFVSLLLGLSMFSALAHAVPSWIIPSPITIALQLGKWMLLEDSDDEVYYIRIQSVGTTETEARTEAFRLAVDQAVGSLLVSETKILDDILNHETINYSSGYIHDFEYVNIHREPNKVTLQVDVWVKKSKIAERISLKNSDQGELQGGRIAESFRSLQQQDLAGDRLLKGILEDFPERAVNIKIKDIEYINNNRRPILQVSFNVWWKEKYIASLREVLQTVGKEQSTDREYWSGLALRGRVQCNGWLCDDKQYVTDKAQGDLIYREIYRKRPNVLVTILDTHSQPVYSACYWWDNMQGNNYGRNQLFGDYTAIYYEALLTNTVQLDLTNSDISRMDRVDLQVVRQKECPNN
jgi:hypothetical protein